MERLKEHLEEVLAAYPNLDWFVIALQGSQNYHMNDKESDIDSKMLVIPSLKDLALNNKPISKTFIIDNSNEHCDVKDVREYLKILRKQNINFMEILFTDYWIVNNKYQDLWLDMKCHAEAIARSNIYRFLKACKGMCLEKQHALCHPYPSKMNLIEKYGWDGKQLSHAERIYNFAIRFVRDKEFYRDCLIPQNLDWLMEIKRNRYPNDVNIAQDMMDDICNKMCQFENEQNKYRKDIIDSSVDKYLNNFLCELIKRSLKGKI